MQNTYMYITVEFNIKMDQSWVGVFFFGGVVFVLFLVFVFMPFRNLFIYFVKINKQYDGKHFPVIWKHVIWKHVIRPLYPGKVIINS